jgi:succinate dehydrogenase / fumarate reductase iron-sulfur subunit
MKQSPNDRAKLDGLYECILALLRARCPSFGGPASASGPAAPPCVPWIMDSHDEASGERSIT